MYLTGRKWLKFFRKSLYKYRHQANQKKNEKDRNWTKFMTGKVLEETGRKMRYEVYRKAFNKKEKNKGEYLTIDAIFVVNTSENNQDPYAKNYDIPALPKVVIELENSQDFEKIRYCLWKIICIHANVKVLVCYQKGKEKINRLIKDCLEKTIQSRLMENDNSQLFVIVGNEAIDNNWYTYSDIDRYFAVFKWKRNKFGQYSFSHFS